MKVTTLRSKMNRMTLLTFACVGISAVAVIVGYSVLQQNLGFKSTAESLKRSASSQVEALIPSFLVHEQKAGVSLLLDRFQSEESLTQIAILSRPSELPVQFQDCQPASQQPVSCLSNDKQGTAVIVPIAETGQTFGYLFKAKQNHNVFAQDNLPPLLATVGLVLLVAFFGLFVVIRRVTTEDVPDSLNELANWVEAVLQDRASGIAPKLKFAELSDLGSKIAEIIDRHDRTRDQAIVGQFASGILHDIKTPLHSVVTAYHLVAEQPLDSPKRPSRLENLLKVCGINIPIIGNIIESTLDGSRDVHVDPKSVDLLDTLRCAIRLNSELAKNARTKVELAGTDGNKTLIVSHDPTQMVRVFSNLIKNGIESAAEQAGLERGPRQVRLTLESGDQTQDDSITIVVEDSGKGLPENPEKLFRAFRSSKARGTGLGLLVSRKIIEAHRGHIVVSKSDALYGARFEVILPTITKPAEAVV